MNWFFFLILSVAIVLIECLIGGTRLVFAYPSYALLGVGALASIFAIGRPLSRPSLPLLLSTLALAGYVLGRAWFSPYDYLARPDLYMAAAGLIVYLITALYLTGSRARLALVGVLLVFCILQVAIGTVQYLDKTGFMLFGFSRLDTGWRASGTLISGNHFAGFLETMAMFGLAIVFWSRQRWFVRLPVGLITVLCYYGVAISGSRGGYLSSAFSLLVFALLGIRTLAISRPGKVVRPALAIFGILTLTLVGAFYAGSQNKGIRARADQLKRSDIRVYNWQATLDHARVEPWLGTGAGTHMIYGRLFRKPPLQSDPIHAHGDYLEMLAEYGVTGEALALLFLAAHFSGGFRQGGRVARARLSPVDEETPTRASGSDAVALNIGAMGAAAALAAHSVVDFNMHIPGNALVYAFVFGLLANPGRTPLPRLPSLFSPAMLCRLGLPLLGGALLLGVVPKYKGAKLTEESRIALRDHHFTKAIELGQQALLHEQANPYTWLYIGEANRHLALMMAPPSLRKRFFTEAVKAHRKGLILFPQDINLLIRLAQSLDGLGQYDEAENVYKKAIQWDPNLGVLYSYLASHYLLRGDAEAAKRLQEKAYTLPHTSEAGRDEVETLLKYQEKKTIE